MTSAWHLIGYSASELKRTRGLGDEVVGEGGEGIDPHTLKATKRILLKRRKQVIHLPDALSGDFSGLFQANQLGRPSTSEDATQWQCPPRSSCACSSR
jgi:hypothetical protein